MIHVQVSNAVFVEKHISHVHTILRREANTKFTENDFWLIYHLLSVRLFYTFALQFSEYLYAGVYVIKINFLLFYVDISSSYTILT